MKTIRQLFGSASRFSITTLLLIMPLAFTGCFATYGKLATSAAVEQDFAQYHFVTNYSYYYLGFESNPYAILGLDSRYHLQQNLWKPLDPKTHILEKMVKSMKDVPACYDCLRRAPKGYQVLAPGGEAIGVLFSCYTWFPVEVKADNLVIVSYPDLARVLLARTMLRLGYSIKKKPTLFLMSFRRNR